MVESGITRRAEALEFLFSRLNFERSAAPSYKSPAFRLDRMAAVLERLGNPHLLAPTVHVAGTKGKGSTCAMVRSILTAAGYRVGLYTSPHLSHLEERFQIDGQPCGEGELVRLTREIQAAVGDVDRQLACKGSKPLTFFEITTAMAFLHFANRAADRVVLETGLGGRLDSTNACRPEVCIITSISLDHTRQLGSTEDRIAREKAGIIKSGVPVVSGATQALAEREIAAAAHAAGSRYELLGRDFDVASRAVEAKGLLDGMELDYRDAVGELQGIRLGLCGAHQARNSALAIRSMRLMAERGWKIGEAELRDGVGTASCPARIERIGSSPWVILDVAHNESSIRALLETMQPLMCRARPRVLIFAASRDKDAGAMLSHLLKWFDHVLLTRFRDNPRARTLEELATAARAAQGASSASVEQFERSGDAWRRSRVLARQEGLICVTGSFFLAGELREQVMNEFACGSWRV